MSNHWFGGRNRIATIKTVILKKYSSCFVFIASISKNFVFVNKYLLDIFIFLTFSPLFFYASIYQSPACIKYENCYYVK